MKTDMKFFAQLVKSLTFGEIVEGLLFFAGLTFFTITLIIFFG